MNNTFSGSAIHYRFNVASSYSEDIAEGKGSRFQTKSNRSSRGERAAAGYDYTSGVWQFEGNFYVPQGSSGVIIMQIHGAATEATTLRLRVYNGDLKYNGKTVVASNIYDKWLRLNVIHNVGAGKVTIFIDGKQKLVVIGHGRANFYFKYGVYGALSASSNYMESRWREVKLFKK
ncbi:hypothetical protein L3X38_041405 [Prunus dulcis]|uniref:Alginate lyase 2 domain-containing protein n=1 Tax=Prunus dulcis TaxID=3755 RepID=A0AAD4YJ49_PRUDU|nr:hypothetical protein L3X38_041405 [Prunus dulcis]